MRGNLLYDGRNLLDPEAAASAGFAYRGIGRPSVEPRPSSKTPEREVLGGVRAG